MPWLYMYIYICMLRITTALIVVCFIVEHILNHSEDDTNSQITLIKVKFSITYIQALSSESQYQKLVNSQIYHYLHVIQSFNVDY